MSGSSSAPTTPPSQRAPRATTSWSSTTPVSSKPRRRICCPLYQTQPGHLGEYIPLARWLPFLKVHPIGSALPPATASPQADDAQKVNLHADLLRGPPFLAWPAPRLTKTPTFWLTSPTTAGLAKAPPNGSTPPPRCSGPSKTTGLSSVAPIMASPVLGVDAHGRLRQVFYDARGNHLRPGIP